MSKSMQHSRQVGFTLIEVLVVVAIIALLIAILVPSLVAARNQARMAVCASNMRQATTGILLTLADQQMRKDRASLNYGWAVDSYKRNGGSPNLFLCPEDPSPRPLPAVYDHQYLDGKLQGVSSSASVFNRMKRDGDNWTLDIQDQVTGDMFGGDSYSESTGDCLIEYTATPGQHTVTATVSRGVTGWEHTGYGYKGGMLWEKTTSNGPVTMPIFWTSFGANASAGLSNVKGAPILLVEAGKLGVFPESFGSTSQGYHYSDNLAKSLRFFHGEPNKVKGIGGPGSDFTQRFNQPAVGTDVTYQPRTRLDASFMDGHIEALAYHQLFDVPAGGITAANKPTIKMTPWIGTRKGDPQGY